MRDGPTRKSSSYLLPAISLAILGFGYSAFAFHQAQAEAKDKTTKKSIHFSEMTFTRGFVDPDESGRFREALDKAGIKYESWGPREWDGVAHYGIDWEGTALEYEKIERIEATLYPASCRSWGGSSPEELEWIKGKLDLAKIEYRELVAYKTYWVEWSVEDMARANALGLGNPKDKNCVESSNHSLKADGTDVPPP